MVTSFPFLVKWSLQKVHTTQLWYHVVCVLRRFYCWCCSRSTYYINIWYLYLALRRPNHLPKMSEPSVNAHWCVHFCFLVCHTIKLLLVPNANGQRGLKGNEEEKAENTAWTFASSLQFPFECMTSTNRNQYFLLFVNDCVCRMFINRACAYGQMEVAHRLTHTPCAHTKLCRERKWMMLINVFNSFHIWTLLSFNESLCISGSFISNWNAVSICSIRFWVYVYV